MKRIRTRYAPSPTGFLHIGGARTALFTYLYAKHAGGDFIIRTEDTDIARNIENGEDSQIDNLEWLGIIADESPRKPVEKYGKYRQSEKLDRYEEIIEEMLEKEYAYKAYDTPQEIDKQRKEQEKSGMFSFRYDRNWLKISNEEKQEREKNGKYAIRVALPKNKEYSWNDIVRGRISVNSDEIGDFVIRKQDGYPTYNFSVVVDDHDMEITHVLRGEEHITNTPKQMAIYDLLNWEEPEFGHFTIITNMEGKKLSKRDHSVKQFIEDYKNEGYHAHAIFNFLTLLGWTHPQAKEMLSHQEIIESFDYKRLSKSPSKFDIKKMDWFSKEYIKRMENSEIESKLNLENKDKSWIDLFIETYKQNAITFDQIQKAFEIYKDSSIKKIEKNEVVKVFADKLNQKNFTPEEINEAIKETKEITGMNGKNLFMPIREATTYQSHGPELAKAIYLFGEEIIKARLK
ncbi:MAG: glutamate--tRNA ligase [Mycoplasmatales bacterium]|nr:glutamate--tRNA ligase [Mycoplasmatales bacterium]